MYTDTPLGSAALRPLGEAGAAACSSVARTRASTNGVRKPGCCHWPRRRLPSAMGWATKR